MKRIIYFLLIVLSSNIYLTAQDTTPPATPGNFRAYSYELHGDLYWDANTEPDFNSYILYKWNGSSYIFLERIFPGETFKMIWFGYTGVSEKYKIQAVDNSNNYSSMSNEVEITTHEMTDDEFMDMVQRAVFRYFWDWGDPTSGVGRERWHPDEEDTTNTIGGGGFGVMGILVGIERGFVTREQGAERILKIADFLANKIDKFHGAFPHWFNGTTGHVVNFGVQDGGDIVETGFMIQGLLCARQYFQESNSTEDQIRSLITQIWEGVDWNFYRNNSTGLYWNWSPDPEKGFNFEGAFIFHGWNETLMPYLLAVASPTHPINPYYYRTGWAYEGSPNNFIKYNGYPKYGYDLYVGRGYGGPLFFTHYSFIGFDPRVKRDLYANYFAQNINQSLINYSYCVDNPKGFVGYNENCWGLTASYSIPGVYYSAHEPNNDNGTIAPTAALSSMPYTPYASKQAMKYFYRTFKEKLWSKFGFKDAFNLTYASNGVSGEWFSDGYLAIDQGPIICMIENYRSQLLWNLFMADPDISASWSKFPFYDSPTPTDVEDETEIPDGFKLNQNYPNPFNPTTTITYTIPTPPLVPPLTKGMDMGGVVTLKVCDILGREVATLVNEYQQPGKYSVQFNVETHHGASLPNGVSAKGGYASGVYFYTLRVSDSSLRSEFQETKKMILMK